VKRRKASEQQHGRQVLAPLTGESWHMWNGSGRRLLLVTGEQARQANVSTRPAKAAGVAGRYRWQAEVVSLWAGSGRKGQVTSVSHRRQLESLAETAEQAAYRR